VLRDIKGSDQLLALPCVEGSCVLPDWKWGEVVEMKRISSNGTDLEESWSTAASLQNHGWMSHIPSFIQQSKRWGSVFQCPPQGQFVWEQVLDVRAVYLSILHYQFRRWNFLPLVFHLGRTLRYLMRETMSVNCGCRVAPSRSVTYRTRFTISLYYGLKDALLF